MDYNKEALRLHRKHQGKLYTGLKVSLSSKDDLSVSYTPGVAEPCREIAKNPQKVYDYTIKGRSVAVVSDGSAVLGLGNIGAEASLPVMEGKCALFKEFADIDAWPICLKTQRTEEIISIVKNIAPGFGGINLEDISAPRCFEIEKSLQDIGIPVFHDDQHGTAIVVTAGLINASKVVGKPLSEMKIVISGAGAAGIAIAHFLANGNIKNKKWLVKNIVMTDSRGIIAKSRSDINGYKKEIAQYTNIENLQGNLANALIDADVFIGVSAPNILTSTMIRKMSPDPIIFALSNPIPEIMPDKALAAGAKIVATGRSDFPNQVNNVLAFPGIFKGALENRIEKITFKMKYQAALGLANIIKKPTPEKILPSVLDRKVSKAVARAIKNCLTVFN